MKKTVLVFLLFAVFFGAWQTNIFAISAASYCVVDAQSGRCLYEKNAGVRRGMASTTKIMTALIALESGKLDEVATVSENAARTEGSSLYLKPGEKITVYDLVCGLMLNSGNDAAVVIAEHISGSVDAFVHLMNEKAQLIGAVDTHFTNPNGLSDDSHYTTAYDLACIATYALHNNAFREIVSTKSMRIKTQDTLREIYLLNHNKLLSTVEGCDGVKTGFTKATGRCLVSSVTQNGFQIICVTLNAPDDWNDHKALHCRAFSEYEKRVLFEEGDVVGKVPVSGGVEATVEGIIAKTVEYVAPKQSATLIETEIVLKEAADAPVSRGDIIGHIIAKQGEFVIGEAALLASRDIAKVEIITYFRIFRNLFKNVFYT